MMKRRFLSLAAAALAVILFTVPAPAQKENDRGAQRVRTVSIPISIFTKTELREGQAEEYIHVERLIVREDKDEQIILSIRSVTEAPLSLAILIQDDLEGSFNLQLKEIGKFIRNLPRGSRVMVGYLRSGGVQIRQRFTEDLDRAADSLRVVTSTASTAPRNPYDGLIDALNRFDALPAGRRAVIVFSDGLDTSQGLADSSPGLSTDLDRAILRAQRRSVAVFSIYNPATLTNEGNSRLILNGQGSLLRLSDETGGRAFFQGSAAAVSFDPFFRDLSRLLSRQFLLSYLSTHMNRGYHRVEVLSTNPEVKIEHPKGYYYR
jgi:VWFA-related protein